MLTVPRLFARTLRVLTGPVATTNIDPVLAALPPFASKSRTVSVPVFIVIDPALPVPVALADVSRTDVTPEVVILTDPPLLAPPAVAVMSLTVSAVELTITVPPVPPDPMEMMSLPAPKSTVPFVPLKVTVPPAPVPTVLVAVMLLLFVVRLLPARTVMA